MKRRAKLPADPPPGFICGADIDLSHWHDHSVAIGVSGDAYCYLGYRPEGRTRFDPPHDLAYFAPSTGTRRMKGRESYRFVRLYGGALRYDRFFVDEAYYNILVDRVVHLPVGANSYFGVQRHGMSGEDTELTRQLFGSTAEELSGLIAAFGALVGHMPRVTFSKTNVNHCDLTRAVIPKAFPYIAFAGSQNAPSDLILELADTAEAERSAIPTASPIPTSRERITPFFGRPRATPTRPSLFR
jgi:hypothetical protein